MPPKIYKSCWPMRTYENRCPCPVDDLKVRLFVEPARGPVGERPCSGDVQPLCPSVAEAKSRCSRPAVYSADTRVGNWFEDTALAAESACALAMRRSFREAQPPANSPHSRCTPMGAPDDSGPMRFGYKVQLLAPDAAHCKDACGKKGLVLHAADLGYGIAAGVPLLGRVERLPNSLSVFEVCSEMGGNERHGQLLLENQPFTLSTTCGSQPLYAAAHGCTIGVPHGSYPVHLTGVPDCRAVWRACAAGQPVRRFAAWGGPVGCGGSQALALYNKATGGPLAVAPYGWMSGGGRAARCAPCGTRKLHVGPSERWRLVCDASKYEG